MLYELQSMSKPTLNKALKSIETSLPCTSQKSSRPTGRGGLEGRAGLCVIHYSICMHVTSISIDCTDLVPLFDFTDRVELSSTLRLHTQVSHFAQNIAKSPSDQPWASSTPHASLRSTYAPGFSTFRKTLCTSLVTVDPTVITLNRLKSSISTQWSSYGPMK